MQMYTCYHKDPSKEPDDVAHFKGYYYQDSNENKYTDPKTGAHFNYQEICAILEAIQKARPPRLSEPKRALKISIPTIPQSTAISKLTIKENLHKRLIRHIQIKNLSNVYKLHNSVKDLPYEQPSVLKRKAQLKLKNKLNVNLLKKSTNSTLVTETNKNVGCEENKRFNFVSLDLRSKIGRNIHIKKDVKKMNLLYTPSISRDKQHKISRIIQLMNNDSDRVYLSKKSKQIN